MNIRVRMYALLLSLAFSGLFSQDEGKKQLFLKCWEQHIERYITENNIALEPGNGTNSILEQWNIKFNLFKRRLEAVKPIYERWKETQLPDNPLWDHGGGHWLLVFLGLKPRFEYERKVAYYEGEVVKEEVGTMKTEEKQIEFVKKELDNAPWVEEYGRSKEYNEAQLSHMGAPYNKYTKAHLEFFGIKVKNEFFKKRFIRIYINNEYTKINERVGGALYYGLTPDVWGIGNFSNIVGIEAKKINNKEFTINEAKLSNSCALLIPEVAIISYQTPYTILYGRLIQYALVYLESVMRYKRILLRKMDEADYYDGNSWLAKRYPIFYQNPLIYDDIYNAYELERKKKQLSVDQEDTSPLFPNYTPQPPKQSQSYVSKIINGANSWWKWALGGTLATVGTYAYLKYNKNKTTNSPVKN